MEKGLLLLTYVSLNFGMSILKNLDLRHVRMLADDTV